MSINPETLDANAEMRRRVLAMTEEQVVDLVTAYVGAWDQLKPEYEAALTELLAEAKDGRVSQAKVRASKRLQRALVITRERLEELAERTNMVITATLPDAVALGAERSTTLVSTQLPEGALGTTVDWARVDEDALAAIVERTTETIHKATAPLPADVEQIMKRELIRGIAVGENPKRTAARMLDRTQSKFNGGLTRALNIARTETISAHNASAYESDKTNADVLAGWTWVAALSGRTCPACLAMHGTEHPVTEPGPYGHQACRCARVPKTKTWAELGIPGMDEFEGDNPVPDAEEWFANLTPDSQRDIMGAERLALYQSGDIQWADLARRQESPGWRPSYVVTPVKDLRKSA